MSGYITIISNKVYQLYGSDVYMILFTNSLDELLNFDSVYLDANQIHFQSFVSDIEMLQRRIQNELNYNKLTNKKNFFMLPNLNNIKQLIKDLINEQKALEIFTLPSQQQKKVSKSPVIKKVYKKSLIDKDVDYDTTNETDDADKKQFRQLLKVMPSELKK